MSQHVDTNEWRKRPFRLRALHHWHQKTQRCSLCGEAQFSHSTLDTPLCVGAVLDLVAELDDRIAVLEEQARVDSAAPATEGGPDTPAETA